MTSRTVTLDEEAYRLLRAARRPDENFSQTVKRLARPQKGISDLAGAWEQGTGKELQEMSRLLAEQAEADRRRADLVRKAWE